MCGLCVAQQSCPVMCGLCVADAGAVADRCPPVQASKKSPSIDSVSASRQVVQETGGAANGQNIDDDRNEIQPTPEQTKITSE